MRTEGGQTKVPYHFVALWCLSLGYVSSGRASAPLVYPGTYVIDSSAFRDNKPPAT
jgi:hypothetical protein